MPRTKRTRGPIPGPRLAHEAARGAADFETHLEDAGGTYYVVAITWGRNEKIIAESCSSLTEALRLARRDPWWQQGGPVEVRSRLGDNTWRMDVDGCWAWIDTSEIRGGAA